MGCASAGAFAASAGASLGVGVGGLSVFVLHADTSASTAAVARRGNPYLIIFLQLSQCRDHSIPNTAGLGFQKTKVVSNC
ncbi:MAG TPA: hypothetical protein VFG22_13140, partial [Polyangiales bacterium]|nr:hypothetical protein [Polyangiales bacterium]